MKKLHVVLIIVIAVSIGAIFTTLTDASEYVDFDKAYEHRGVEYHVIGKIDSTGDITYDPMSPNEFKFTMVDNNGISKDVVVHMSKPQDFEKSEQVVLIGKASENSDIFHASNVLMKCPSKYNDGASDGGFKTEAEMREIREQEYGS